MLKWPDAATVDAAVRAWAAKIPRQRSDVVSIGYFGSYARGDWGVGSDLDLIVIVEQSNDPFQSRALEFNLLTLPVPADLLVYTRAEWQSLVGQNTRFARMLRDETVWVSGPPA